MSTLWRFFRSALLLLLAGCATVPPTRLALDQSLEYYVLEGRFGLRDQGNAYQGKLTWQHDSESNRVMVRDPFGGGVAELIEQTSGARMVQADGTVSEAGDGQALMQQLTGVALPVRSVARWLTGRALPPTGVVRDQQGRPSSFVSEGWAVNYEYPADLQDELPSRVVAANGRGLELRLAIDRWDLVPMQ